MENLFRRLPARNGVEQCAEVIAYVFTNPNPAADQLINDEHLAANFRTVLQDGSRDPWTPFTPQELLDLFYERYAYA